MHKNLSVPFSSRNYQDLADLVLMEEMLMQARQQTTDWQYAHIGELIFNYWQIAIHLNPTEFIRLWFCAGQLVGYATLGEDPSFDFQVLPMFEWQGIEEEAISWAETRLADLRQVQSQQWSGKLVSGARRDNLQRQAFLERHGFRQGGEFSEVNMLGQLAGSIPAPEIPAGFELHSMDSFSDIHARAEVQRVVWSPWSVGELSDVDYSLLMSLPGYLPDLDIFITAPDGKVVSYVNGWIDPVNKIGDFGPVGAVKNYRRRGLTRAVLLECERRMQSYGMQRVAVSTNLTNPAQKLYALVGCQPNNQYLEYIQQGLDDLEI